MPNTARVPPPPFLSRAVAGLVLFALAAGCDSPTGPSQSRREASQPESRQPESSQPRPNLGGTYSLTLSASSRCRLELPEEFRTRSYPATIVHQGPGSLTVTVHSNRYPGWDYGRFTGEFGEANDVIFQLALEDWWDEGGAEYHASGRMTATIVEEGLSGFLDGVMEGSVSNEDGRGYRNITCRASDHGAVFSR